jgi:hypothetical protein
MGQAQGVTRAAPGSEHDRHGKGVRAILNRFGKALIMSAATAAVIGMAAAPAFATAATWTVKPGGATIGTAGKTVITDKTAGQSVTCTSSVAKGTLKSGSGLAGAGLGTIASLAFKGCTILGQTVAATITGKMPLNGISYNATTKTAIMTITKIHGSISVASLGCSAIVDGTGAAAHNGMVRATFANGTDILKVLAGSGNLHLYNNTCPVINSGDAVNFTGAYKLTPKQVITSP